MIPNVAMQQALADVIDALQTEIADAKLQITNNETTIEVLSEKYIQITEYLEKVVAANSHAEPVGSKKCATQKDFSHKIIDKMHQENIRMINTKWVAENFACHYHAASKRIEKAIQKGLLIRHDKGVYVMTAHAKQQMVNNPLAPLEKTNVPQIVKTTNVKVPQQTKMRLQVNQPKKIPSSIDKLPRTDKAPSVGETARAILRETKKPMHGVTELYPELVRRGLKLRSPSVGKILSALPGIKRVAPNTWALDDAPPQDFSPLDQQVNADSILPA